MRMQSSGIRGKQLRETVRLLMWKGGGFAQFMQKKGLYIQFN